MRQGKKCGASMVAVVGMRAGGEYPEGFAEKKREVVY